MLSRFGLTSVAAAAALVVAGGVQEASASHIDELGYDVSLHSSDGAGNFTIRFREFFGADGGMWTGSTWRSTDLGSPTLTATLELGTGTLSPSGTQNVNNLTFDGLVDSMGVQTAGFGTSQVNTQYVNGTSDAAQYSQLFNFSISGFDATNTYKIEIVGNDCCFVSGGSVPQLNQSIIFDPAVVVDPNVIPTPAAAGACLVGLAAMGLRRARKQA